MGRQDKTNYTTMRILIILIFITTTAAAQVHVKTYDWENGSGRLQGYYTSSGLQNPPHDLMEIGTDSAGLISGTQSGRFEVRYTDVFAEPLNKNRAEIQNRADSIFFGYNHTIQFSIRVPVYQQQNNVVPFALYQYHDKGSIGSPNDGISMKNGYFWYGTNYYDKSGTAPVQKKSFRLIKYVPGKVYDFQVYHKFRTTTDGQFILWINGQIARGIPCTPDYGSPLSGAVEQDIIINGRNNHILPNGDHDYIGYVKHGEYIWNLKTSSEVTSYVLYYDNIKYFDSTNNPYSVVQTYGGDTTAPSVPTGLTSSATTGSSFALSWTASTGTPSGYDIYLNGIFKDSSSTNSKTITGLTSYTTYAVTVRSKDASGNLSTFSSPLSVTTLDTIKPTTPFGLVATGATQTSVNLSWTASTDNRAVTGYYVKQAGTTIATVTATNYVVTGLTAATSYSFTVQAFDAAGNLSTVSSSVTTATIAAPDVTAPTAPTALNYTNLSQTFVTINWTASTDATGVVGYYIYRAGVLVGTVGNTLSFTETGLADNTTFSYTVKAFDLAGNISTASSALSVTTPVLRPPSDNKIIISNIIPKN